MPRDFSFPKARRLKRTAEFNRVRVEGRKLRGSLISLGVMREDSNNHMRVGIITSRKVGGAVARNRIRRRLREIVRRHQHSVSKGIWMVVIASHHAGRATYRELEVEWLRLAGRASILAP